MDNSLLLPDKDPMGKAIADYFAKGKAAKLRVFSSQFDEDEIPVKHLFRTYDEMSPMEQKALNLAQGKILDCGAGSGCHALALQDMGKDVDAIDISPLSVEVMEKRGVQNASQVDLFHHTAVQKYDTVLMLMNGSGIIGKIENMGEFFTRMKQILKPGGVVYMDSSDLKYLFEDEDGNVAYSDCCAVVAKKPELALFLLVYTRFNDDYDLTYHWQWSGVHKGSKKLDRLYAFLEAMGYVMSHEERELQDGTHPLFQKEDA